MIKYLRPAFLLLSNLLFLHGNNAQVQTNVADYLTQRFLGYCTKAPREEIFVHCDREDYIAGEDLWFNIYLLDRQSTTPSLSGKIAYFELLNQENLAVVQKRIKIDKGFGPGQINIPDTLSTGTYTIRAYTNWMKNFLPENCFMKEISVYNAFSNKAFVGKTHPDIILKNGINSAFKIGTGNSGLTLEVNNLKPDILEINVNANNSYRSENNNVFYLFIQTHGIINHVSSETIQNEETRINIPKKVLVPGINHITIFDSRGNPFCERFIYTPDTGNQFLNIHSPENYKKRSQVSVDIEFEAEYINELNLSNLSISVVPQTNTLETIEINDYMIFGSEFGIHPWNTVNGRKISELTPGEMDSLLLTLKSNWINWERILSDNLPNFKYKHENEYHFLEGKLINRNPGATDSGRFVIMSTPGKEAIFQYAKTDNENNFIFNLNIDEWIKDLIIQPVDKVNDVSIKIESSFSEQFLQSDIYVDNSNRIKPSHISPWSINYQVTKIYGVSNNGEPLNPVIPALKPKRFYGKPDIELIMDDYIKLPVMEEVFFELMQGVFLKNKKSVYEITVADPVTNKIYETPPGLFIDGVMIKDPALIANLEPEIVEKIDAVHDRYYIGDYLFFGIVNVISRAGDYSSVTLPDDAIRVQYNVVDPVRSFVSPDYSSTEMKNNRIPDFRNTLYWNPSVKPDENGKVRIEFWTSDILSDYQIDIQGITPEGKLISYKKNLKVE